MSFSFKAFLVTDDDVINSVPLTRYNAMKSSEVRGALPQFASREIRLAFLEVYRTESVRAIVSSASYMKFRLNDQGLRCEGQEWDAFAGAVVTHQEPQQSSDGVLGRLAFEQRRIAIEHLWEPSTELETALADAAIGLTKPARLDFDYELES